MTGSDSTIPYGLCQCGCGQRTRISTRTRSDLGHKPGQPIPFVLGHQAKTRAHSKNVEKHRRSWEEERPDTPYGSCWCGCGEKTSLSPATDKAHGYVKGCPRYFIRGHASRKNPQRYRVEDRGYKTPCWIWLGNAVNSGYGRITRGNQSIMAHRYYCEQAHGPIPQGHDVDHLCRIPLCVNPGHLEPVTPAENSRRRPSTKLSPEVVIEIRALYDSGQRTQAALATKYGVTRSTISRVVCGNRWRQESL